MKYNFALTPLHHRQKIIHYAQQLSHLTDQYILGEHSLPHVTLYQCHFDESEIKYRWQNVCQTLEQKLIELSFANVSCTTSNQEVYWISLMPDQRNILTNMHQTIAAVLNLPVKEDYDPHMTLLNTKDPRSLSISEAFKQTYSPIIDTFVLSLGNSDEIGQYTQVIYQRL